MAAPFQKSWSMHGFKRNGVHYNGNFDRNRPMFHSGRSSRSNLQDRFAESPLLEHQYENIDNYQPPQEEIQQNEPQDENDCPFYLRPQPGMKFRSLTDTNIRRFEVNGVAKTHNQIESPKTRFRHPFRQLPEKIAPILNNIQNTMVQAGPRTEKFISKGGKKVTKAFGEVCTSINSWSQKFKKSTQRRYKLDNTNLNTPTRTPTRSHSVNRHTPGKLYSPFDVNTPRTPYSYGKGPKRLQHGPSKRSLYGADNMGLLRTPQNQSSRGFHQWARFESPSSHFHQASGSSWMENDFSPYVDRRNGNRY